MKNLWMWVVVAFVAFILFGQKLGTMLGGNAKAKHSVPKPVSATDKLKTDATAAAGAAISKGVDWLFGISKSNAAATGGLISGPSVGGTAVFDTNGSAVSYDVPLPPLDGTGNFDVPFPPGSSDINPLPDSIWT